MGNSTRSLINELADDLTPIRPIRLRNGLLLVIGAVLITVIAIELMIGLWRGVLQGEASTFFVLTNGLLLVLGCASVSSVLRMATPRVGNSYEGPRWVSFALAILPIAALVSVLGNSESLNSLVVADDLACLGWALGASSLVGAALFLWLRRGAPVSPNSAGLHLGVAATSIGSAAYGLACSLDETVHLGVWHVAPVLIGAIIGRLFIARLLRW